MSGIVYAIAAIVVLALTAVAVPKSRAWIAGIAAAAVAGAVGFLALSGKRKPAKPVSDVQRRLEEHDHGHQESVRRRVRDAEEERQRRQEIADIPDEVERLEAELADWKS